MPLFLAEVSSGEECLNYIFLCTAEQHISLCWLPTFHQSLISLPCFSPPQKQDQPTFWGFMPCWLKASMWKSSCVGRAFAERSLLQHLWPTTGWRLAELPLVTLKVELFSLPFLAAILHPKYLHPGQISDWGLWGTTPNCTAMYIRVKTGRRLI